MPHTSYYELLGAARDATEMEIRSASGRAALARRDDSGSISEDLKLKTAFDTLVDPERRVVTEERTNACCAGTSASTARDI